MTEPVPLSDVLGPIWLTLRCHCGRKAAEVVPPWNLSGLPLRSFFVVYARPFWVAKHVGIGPRSFGADEDATWDEEFRSFLEGFEMIVVAPNDHGPLTLACDRNHGSVVELDDVRQHFEAAQARHRETEMHLPPPP